MSEVIERYVRRFPGGSGRVILSMLIVFITGLAALLLSSISMLLVRTFLILFITSFLGFFLVRFLRFKRISKYLLKDRKYSRGPRLIDRFGKFSQGLLMLMLMFLPFILIPFMPPDMWLGFLLGLFCGSNFGELCFYSHVRFWERKNNLLVFSYWLWDFTIPTSPELLELGYFARPIKREKQSARANP